MTPDYLATKISRAMKELRLRQKAISVWMTGLSGAGKTTLGLALEKILFSQGYFVQLLDGDNVRSGLNKDLLFSDSDRRENIRRIAEVNALFNASGIITIDCFISPTHEIRQMAKKIIGPENFIEIFVTAPLSLCETRDVKGFYKKARQGLIKEFTGIDSPFENPLHPDLVVDTSILTVEQEVDQILNFILPKIRYS